MKLSPRMVDCLLTAARGDWWGHSDASKDFAEKTPRALMRRGLIFAVAGGQWSPTPRGWEAAFKVLDHPARAI